MDDRAKSWIFTIYVLFNLIGTPLMAKLSDIFGRRSIYILDIGMFALGSLVVSLSPHNLFSVLLVGRALQGFGASGVFPVASAVIGDVFPAEKRGSALGLIGAELFGSNVSAPPSSRTRASNASVTLLTIDRCADPSLTWSAPSWAASS